MSQSPAEYYRAQEARASAEALRLENRALRVSRLRVVTFLGAAACILLLETTPRESWTVLLVSGGAGLVAFVGLVCLHRSLSKRSARERLREGISREARARLARRWAEVADPVAIEVRAGHPYAGDLDVVGRASLTHLLGRVTTIPGKAMLAHALLNPLAHRPSSARVLLANSRNDRERPATDPDPDSIEEVRRRQGVVRALVPERSFRERLELLGREGRQSGGTLERGEAFLAWLEEPRWLESHPAVLRTGRFLGVFTPASLIAWLLGWTPGLFPVLGAVGALVLHRATAKHTAPTLRGAEAAQSVLGASAKLLEAAEEMPGESGLVAELRRKLRTPGPGAGRSIRHLVRLTDLANVRKSMLHFPLVALFSWDVQVADRLERWHARYGAACSEWMRCLGEIEVCSALAGLSFDHPDWCFPQIASDEGRNVGAAALGHPLLDPEICVRNDVELPSPHSLLLVTGSNMAGKSTLLRSIGVNQVLALIGGPVCARQFRTRPLLPWTVMRVDDSLEEGVSHFLAELKRLKRVVDGARAGPILFLLDEILTGTNSEERLTAARIVLRHLLRTRAVGAVTTHDLALASTGILKASTKDVHFREELRLVDGKRRLAFDYVLRDGPATSRNALLLLEMVGLA